MAATQEQEVPYLSPEDYVRLREPVQTTWKIAGLSDGVWPSGTPLEFKRLTALTTPRERLEGIRGGQWPFEWRDMLRRTPEEVAEMRYRERMGELAPIPKGMRAPGEVTFNIEEFSMGVDEAWKLLYPNS